MTARERILMIRLMEKMKKHPTYAILLGIEATGAVNDQILESDPKGLTSARGPLYYLEGRKESADICYHLVHPVFLDHR